ncbi:N-methyl-L-tryptophan oxidase [Caballeronia insecticola]|nr:N-methyl-L-tryptophan oxidase [Caballeronia insecticola]
MNETIADVVVVGLGAFGSATAFQLAKRGLKVIGIDRFAPPHDRGSSHGNTRITRLAAGEGEAYIPFIKRSHEIWRALEAQTGRTLYHRTGGLVIGARDSATHHHAKPDFLQQTIANARQFGIEHEVLTAADMSKRYPQFRLRGDELAYFEPDAGVLIPEACIETQIELARASGASIRFNEPVIDIKEQGDGVIVRTALGKYAAARVVVTAGAWIPGMAGGKMAEHLRVMRQTLHWFATTDPSLYSPARCPIFIWMHGNGDHDYMYGFPMIDGQPGVKVATEQYEAACTPDDFDRHVGADESRAMFDAHVAGRLAAVTSTTVHAAACLYTVSTDSGFVIDRYRDMKNVKVVSACSGHGFKNSAGFGERLALWAAGHDDDTLDRFQVSRLDAYQPGMSSSTSRAS